jgi:hypothetical protein
MDRFTYMGPQGHKPFDQEAVRGQRQQELLATLHSAVRALTLCVDQITTLIARTGELIAQSESVPAPAPSPVGPVVASAEKASAPPLAAPEPRVAYGGGPSVLGELWERDGGLTPSASRTGPAAGAWHLAGAPGQGGGGGPERERERAREALRGLDLSGPISARPLSDVSADRAGTHELMAVSELAHLGYSREEISRRLHARWGERAGAILREALG